MKKLATILINWNETLQDHLFPHLIWMTEKMARFGRQFIIDSGEEVVLFFFYIPTKIVEI